MPRIELETPEQKQRFDDWIEREVWKRRFIRGAIMPLLSDNSGTLEVYYTNDDGIVLVNERSDYVLRKPVLVTSERFMQELRTAGVIFERQVPIETRLNEEIRRTPRKQF